MPESPRYSPLFELSRVRLLALLREPEAVFWVFVFPIAMALVLGFAFRDKAPERLPVGVLEGPASTDLRRAIESSSALKPESFTALEPADLALRNGKIVLLVLPGPPVSYRFDPTRPDSRTARLAVNDAVQAAHGRRDSIGIQDDTVHEKGARYIDFLLPGLIGLNLMGTSMWGIGFSILNARLTKTLKLLAATPMKRSDYLASQITARLVFLFLEVPLILGVGILFFGVPMRGGWAAFLLVCLVGAISFAGVALMTVSRAKTLESGSGLMNFIMVPMWLVSGSFFSSERFPKAVQPLVQALPLTALNNSLRSVMLEGRSLAAVAWELAIISAWGVVTFLIALKIFRWQ
jgi:ABC-type multidrug transport system permease subunit